MDTVCWRILSLLQHAVDPGGPPPDAPIMQAIADPVLQQARETEARMDRALPDFLCQEMVARSENGVENALSAEVSYNGKSGRLPRNPRERAANSKVMGRVRRRRFDRRVRSFASESAAES